MSHRSVSAMRRFCGIATIVFLLAACADSTAPTATPLALSGAATQTAPAAQANQPLPVTATSTPEPTATSASAHTATATPPPPKPTATFTPAPTEPPVTTTATPPEVAHGVEFAIERKTIEAPDGSNLEVVGWSTGRLGIYFEKAFADGAYTFGLDGSKKEAGAILVPNQGEVDFGKIQEGLTTLANVVAGVRLGLLDASRPISRTDLEMVAKYLVDNPNASYVVESGGEVIGSVTATAPIEFIFVRPKLNAERTMAWDFPKDEAGVMAPFTEEGRSWELSSGRGQHLIRRDGGLAIFSEQLLVGGGSLQGTDLYWLPGAIALTVDYEVAGAYDKRTRAQVIDLLKCQGLRHVNTREGSSLYSINDSFFETPGKPPKNPFFVWGQPGD